MSTPTGGAPGPPLPLLSPGVDVVARAWLGGSATPAGANAAANASAAAAAANAAAAAVAEGAMQLGVADLFDDDVGVGGLGGGGGGGAAANGGGAVAVGSL